jgi:hypothetical protein
MACHPTRENYALRVSKFLMSRQARRLGARGAKSAATAELIPTMASIAAQTYFITHSSIESEAW